MVNYADQITFPNGKYYYTGLNSVISTLAKRNGHEVKAVRYSGNCIYANINSRAHEGFDIYIDGVKSSKMLDKIMTQEEYKNMGHLICLPKQS